MEAGARRNKLGLALAGGGFRASIFHLGVLRRLAELDLLRYVELLSTVSGGSIVGALYILILKRRLHESDSGNLSRAEYLQLVSEVETILLEGVKKDLRTRLLTRPLAVLAVLCTSRSLGEEMSRLYEKHIYKKALETYRLDHTVDGARVYSDLDASGFARGRILLRDVRIKPRGKPLEADNTIGIEAFNADATYKHRSASTQLVVNATSLNSGGRFGFSNSELGDWYLGYFRGSEVKLVLDYKKIIEEERQTAGDESLEAGTEKEKLARWLHGFREDRRKGEIPRPLSAGYGAVERSALPAILAETDFGLFREIKGRVWYMEKGFPQNVTGGFTAEEHEFRLVETLRKIQPGLADFYCGLEIDERKRTRTFLLDLYYLRTAEVASKNLERDYNSITLGQAVGASACFPPVFPPFILEGLYDDWYVSRLGLTDGGVYDNVGITALLDEGCTHIIASDTSGLFGTEPRSSSGRLAMIGRLISSLQATVAGFQRTGLEERRRVSDRLRFLADFPVEAVGSDSPVEALPSSNKREFLQALQQLRNFHTATDIRGLVFFHIASPEIRLKNTAAQPVRIDRKAIAEIRTDLDGFGDLESQVLINHGYNMADLYIRDRFPREHYVKDSAAADADMIARLPYQFSKGEEKRLQRAVQVGRHRWFRLARYHSRIFWTLSLLCLLGAALIWDDFPVRDLPLVSAHLAGSFHGAFWWALEQLHLATFAGRLSDFSHAVLMEAGVLSFKWTVLALGLVAVIAGVIRGPLTRRAILTRDIATLRRIGFLSKKIMGLWFNLTWLLFALPLLLTLLMNILAGLSYLLGYLPLSWAMRRTKG